jgi:hypothetical protein
MLVLLRRGSFAELTINETSAFAAEILYIMLKIKIGTP